MLMLILIFDKFIYIIIYDYFLLQSCVLISLKTYVKTLKRNHFSLTMKLNLNFLNNQVGYIELP